MRGISGGLAASRPWHFAQNSRPAGLPTTENFGLIRCSGGAVWQVVQTKEACGETAF
jgi:hypothetical protein